MRLSIIRLIGLKQGPADDQGLTVYIFGSPK